ncbi:MAG TPA: biosynthetic arginine decarboxylase [Thermoanaerobaculia bacterium]|nr:biosynthetic arginine decarboxylase [Thermoanaerobaculia bacterium]
MSVLETDRAAAAEDEWTLDSARELYRVEEWGKGYFGINARGHVTVRPRQDESSEVDLFEVVHGLHARGLTAPLLLRFPDLLEHRLEEIYQAFQEAIGDNGYRGRYHAVYPIKVNQQRHVVDEVYRYGARFGFGLEVGSKPELLAALALTGNDGDRPIICNGFKDDEYIESAVLARKLGRNIIPVVESFPELLLIAKHSERYGVAPRFGMRVKLAASGAGRWSESAGYRSKFGLTIPEVIDAMKVLDERGMKQGLELLHCHMGSQIHDIKNIKDGINELAHVYVGLTRMGAGLRYLDVGGGLAVDYDGSQSNFESSMNYTLREYASDVIYRVMNVCDNAQVAHPTIITECGRAMVAFHSLLLFDVLGASTMEQRFAVPENLEEQLDEEVPQPIFDLLDAYRSVADDSLVQSFHDALHARDEAMHLFSLGYLSLPLRALAERLFWATCTRLRALAGNLEEMPEELEELDQDTRDTYFCNFSLFQSVPDSWALRQVFPVMPIHRLEQRPTRRGILADITCDSDGKLDIFPDPRVMKKTLELHPVIENEEYYLAVFLVGAYQETLGDLHNLFGDTHVVHLKVEANGHWSIAEVVEGDTVREVLSYFQYNPEDLFDRIFQDCEVAVREGRMTLNESRSLLSFYRNGLNGYTYLEAEEP